VSDSYNKNSAILGDQPFAFSATLDDVETYLEEGARRGIGVAQRL
jgi:hypothetical protein